MTPSDAPLSLYFDTQAFSPEAMAEVFAFLADLSREMGGDGLLITEGAFLCLLP